MIMRIVGVGRVVVVIVVVDVVVVVVVVVVVIIVVVFCCICIQVLISWCRDDPYVVSWNGLLGHAPFANAPGSCG